MLVFNKLKRFLMTPVRFFMNISSIINAIVEVIVLEILIGVFYVYIVGNVTLFNTTATGSGSSAAANSTYSFFTAVTPLIQVGLLIGGILGAIVIIYFTATHMFKGGK